MACDGGAASERAQLVNVGREPILLNVPRGSKMHDVKLESGKFLGGGSFRLITEVLEVDDVVQGTVQVQRINIPVGKWSELCSGMQWLR